jgi:hypothetical protein
MSEEELKQLLKVKGVEPNIMQVMLLYKTYKTLQRIAKAVEPSPKPKPKYDFTWSEKLEITSPKANTFSTKKVEVPMTGELKKVTVRPSTADEDDYFQLLHGGRVLIDKIYTYGATSASHTFLPEKEEGIPIAKGETLSLRYFNAGSSSKNVDITFHIIIF